MALLTNKLVIGWRLRQGTDIVLLRPSDCYYPGPADVFRPEALRGAEG